MQIQVIIIIVTSLFCVDYIDAKNFSDVFISRKDVILQENEEVIISFISDLDVDSKGNFWIIDWDNHTLNSFDKLGNSPRIVARKGNGPGELMMPHVMHIDKRDHIFIASFTNRITEFDAEGNFIRSFICTDGHMPTSCIAVTSNGNILVGGRKYYSQNKNQINLEENIHGTMIHLYSFDGTYIKSFYDMDPLVRKRNLDKYSASSFTIDYQNQIYASQPVNYVISVFNEKGDFLKTLGSKQPYYKEPKTLTRDIKRNKADLEKYEQNFTCIGELFIYKNFLISIAKIFGGIDNDQIQYFIDFYDKDNNQAIVSGIETEKRLMRVKNDQFYFLTTKENMSIGEIKNVIEIYQVKKFN